MLVVHHCPSGVPSHTLLAMWWKLSDKRTQATKTDPLTGCFPQMPHLHYEGDFCSLHFFGGTQMMARCLVPSLWCCWPLTLTVSILDVQALPTMHGQGL